MSGAPIRIFIVDDDELILKSLARVLRRPGFEVVSFATADAVLARLGEAPDLLICDYHLPGVDGVTIAGHAKLAYPNARTILLSGGVEDDVVQAAMDAKVVDRFASKPWHHDDLLALVDGLLAR